LDSLQTAQDFPIAVFVYWDSPNPLLLNRVASLVLPVISQLRSGRLLALLALQANMLAKLSPRDATNVPEGVFKVRPDKINAGAILDIYRFCY